MGNMPQKGLYFYLHLYYKTSIEISLDGLLSAVPLLKCTSQQEKKLY